MRGDGPEQESWEALRRKAIGLLQYVEQWRQEWEGGQRAPAVEGEPDPLTSLTWDPTLNYPTKAMHFLDFNTAHEVALHLIALAVLGSHASLLRDPMNIIVQVLGKGKADGDFPKTVPSPNGTLPAFGPLEDNLRLYSLAQTIVGTTEGASAGQVPFAPVLGAPTFVLTEHAVGLMDYLLLERHRGKGAFTVLVLLRLW